MRVAGKLAKGGRAPALYRHSMHAPHGPNHAGRAPFWESQKMTEDNQTQETKKFLNDFLIAVMDDIDNGGVDFDTPDLLRIIAAAEGFGAFIQKIIEEKKYPDDRPLKGKL